MATTTNTQHILSTYILSHHLKVAREMYLDTAKSMRDAGLEIVAQQFDKQAQECLEWSEALIDYTHIEVPYGYDNEVIILETP